MGIQIIGGTGNNLPAGVNSKNRLDVSSQSNSRLFYISRDGGQSYKSIMDGYSATANDHVFYWKNTSTDFDAFVFDLKVSALNASSFRLYEVTGTAAAGDVITDSNINLGSGSGALSSAMGGTAAITGLTTGKILGVARVPANSESIIDFSDGLIIAPGKAIAVEYHAGTAGLCEVSMLYHFEQSK